MRFTWEQSAILAVWTEWWQGVSHVARVYLNLWLGRERRSIYEILDPEFLIGWSLDSQFSNPRTSEFRLGLTIIS